ncbi:MAG: formyltetrahydrofolate deformylase [Bryobacteraceae bacterium]
MKNSAILLIDSPDRKGLVAKISTFLYEHGANILHADQHRDNEAGLFFMRIEWDLDGFALDDAAFHTAFEPLAAALGLRWRVEYSRRLPRMAIFVSKYLHCLADLLHRQQSGELACTIPAVIGNHEHARALAGFYGIPFHLIPVTAAAKQEAEVEQLAILDRCEVDLIVLARYMQVLSPQFVARYPGRIINVHHSFLPAFSGARPYEAAYRRGVKLIGATSHYVSEVLDDGPIIEQDVTRISHRDQLDDLVQKGRDVERLVLSRAVRWHLDRRILLYENKTVIFD